MNTDPKSTYVLNVLSITDIVIYNMYVCIRFEPNAYPFAHIDKVLARLNGNG